VLALLLVASGTCAAPPEEPAPRELIVHFRAGSEVGKAAALARRVRPGVHVIAVDSDDRATHAERWRRLQEHMESWRGRPGVRLVEPNYTGRFEAVPDAAPPNDPGFSNQWWLRAVGALGLWPIGQGRGIKVALVDSGVSLAHPDLAANLHADGYDFGDDDPDPNDGLGHGTGVAGVLAAVANNGVGIAGLAPAVRVLPIKVSVADTSTFTASTVAQAVDYAVAKGARVINLSLTFNPDQGTELLRQSIQAALDRGIAVVAAAGNGAGPVAFPGNLPGVIAVAATDRLGGLYITSNRGPEVAIAAPGADILTTTLRAGYASQSGTSFAAPMVAGAMAALMSINESVPVTTLVSLLRSAASPINGPSAAPPSGPSSGQAFGQLHAGRAAVGLLPALTLSAGPWTSQRSFEAAYRLPPLVSPADLHVAVTTPVGEYVLLPDCTWAGVSAAGYKPFARSYSAVAPTSGVLFGQGGVCAPIPLAGLPAGAYNWRVAATTPANGLIGAVNSEAMEIVP
jgi:thermitase